MISITKQEAMWLATQGAKYKNIIHRTVGVAKLYYMTEDRNWMRRLKEYRNSKIVK